MMAKPGRPRIELELSESVLARYASGELDHHSVGQLCGVSPHVALRELRRAGMDTSRSTRRQLQVMRRVGLSDLYENIENLYGMGLSLREVAEQFGMTQEGVRQVLLRQGAKIRKRRQLQDLPAAEQAASRRMGRLIRSLRKQARMSENDLAARSNLSRRTILILEQGARRATPETLVRLAEALGTTVDQLQEGTSRRQAETCAAEAS
jgi:transcriptional regulator with XRE-family HTH domain